jgi:hypothetical protein
MLQVWTPALLFSTGNPSVAPNPIHQAAVNLTLQAADGSVFPLFAGGMSRRVRPVGAWETLPGMLAVDAAMLPVPREDEVQEVCVAPDSDELWMLSPPAATAFARALDDQASLQLQVCASRASIFSSLSHTHSHAYTCTHARRSSSHVHMRRQETHGRGGYYSLSPGGPGPCINTVEWRTVMG